MSYGTSRGELIRYLKGEAEWGSDPVSTSLSRMASVRKVLTVLSDQEAKDVTDLDVDRVMRRFMARSKHPYSLASQVSYKSRLKSSLQAFNAARAKQQKEVPPTAGPVAKEPEASNMPRPYHSIQIPLHETTVIIDRLPIDLTEGEAQRLAGVLLAYAVRQADDQ